MSLPTPLLRRPGFARSLFVKTSAAALALALAGCVVAPRPYYHHPLPRVRLWVPFPIFFVPVGGYQASAESTYDRDRQECYRHAVRETGIDPGGMSPINERASSSSSGGAEVAAGAAVGAVAGGIVSSSRNAGAGMVIGAILGAAAGAAAHDARERSERVERADRADRSERAEREYRARRDSPDEMTRNEQEQFRRAMSDCMERRGYRAR